MFAFINYMAVNLKFLFDMWWGMFHNYLSLLGMHFHGVYNKNLYLDFEY